MRNEATALRGGGDPVEMGIWIRLAVRLKVHLWEDTARGAALGLARQREQPAGVQALPLESTGVCAAQPCVFARNGDLRRQPSQPAREPAKAQVRRRPIPARTRRTPVPADGATHGGASRFDQVPEDRHAAAVVEIAPRGVNDPVGGGTAKTTAMSEAAPSEATQVIRI
eukprot:CAMPEP_0179891980 /NCGR_PEP_ID=MMETSP0982-20121206/33975_1 /TAXON_ID=483367 /ORGANISM="non described non described, Strain CCMP 2436" /LENGTH=168 /DNA_ID=CAMNT_0021788407 /DNA_START=956 /DNA_END=1461 /DNA_ORIENTATION=+